MLEKIQFTRVFYYVDVPWDCSAVGCSDYQP